MSVGKSRFQLRHGGQEIDIGPSAVVGREADCELMLKGALISRRHARFSQCPEGLTVADLGSLNGVFVNERRITEPTTLAHGDVVAIGTDIFEVMDSEVVPRAKRPTMPQPPIGRGTGPLSPPPYAKSDVDDDGPEQVTKTTNIDILTERERQVFELLVLGHTQGEIASKLHLSVKTVETHRAHIADKLCCRTRAELVAYALTSGVLHRGNVRTQDKP